jgi:hypothetical protein
VVFFLTVIIFWGLLKKKKKKKKERHHHHHHDPGLHGFAVSLDLFFQSLSIFINLLRVRTFRNWGVVDRPPYLEDE